MGCGTLFALKMTGEIDEFSLLEPGFAHVVRVHENDSSAVVNAPVSIVEAVDRCIELVVAPDRHHPVLSGLQGLIFNPVNREFGFSFRVAEFAPIARRMRQVKIAVANSFVEPLETRDDAGD